MNISVRAIINSVYTSPKNGTQYVRGVDLDTGGQFTLTSPDVDFKAIEHKTVSLTLDVEPAVMIAPGNTKPGLMLRVNSAKIKAFQISEKEA